MRTVTLLRRENVAVYVVECRYHERSVWAAASSRFTELVYPLQGGYLLDHDAAVGVCLPARLILIPGGASYRIRHFCRLADRTLVISMRRAPYVPRGILHLFLGPGEVCGLQSLAASLRKGDATATGALPKLLASIVSRISAASIPQSRLVAGADGLERSIEHMLTSGANASPEECARATGSSVHHFRHRFRETYATTPHRVVRTLRLAHALRYMLEGATATAAAQVTGFTHVSHLSNEFRRTTGRSPMALLSAIHAHGVREAATLWQPARNSGA